MNFTIHMSTRIREKNIRDVWRQFDSNLFMALKPPGVKIILERFDGCLTGDTVSMWLITGPFRMQWAGIITAHQESDTEIFFRDEGRKMPSFLNWWQHTHRIIQDGNDTVIRDEICYRSPNVITGLFFYPVFWLQFAWRKPVYRKYFR